MADLRPDENDFFIIYEFIKTDKIYKKIKASVINNVVLRGGIELNIAHDRYWQLKKS